MSTFIWKVTALIKPTIEDEYYLVFNPCDGFRVAEWIDGGFYQFGDIVPLSTDLAFFWCELPTIKEMAKMHQKISCLPVNVEQVLAPEPLAILIEKDI